MKNNAFNSKSIQTASALGAGDGLRDLVAAMPIVIFANALRAVLARPTGARATLLTSESR
jgi:hypothetical protein